MLEPRLKKGDPRRGRLEGRRLERLATSRGVRRSRRGSAGDGIPSTVEKLLLLGVYTLLAAALVVVGSPGVHGAGGAAGVLLLIAGLNHLFARHLLRVEPGFVRSTRSQAGVYVLVLVVLGLARVLHQAAGAGDPWMRFLVPVSLVALVARIVHGQRFALEATTYTTFLLGLVLFAQELPGEELMPLLLVLYCGGLVAALLADSIRKRSKLVKVGVAIGGVQVLVLLALQLLGPPGGDPWAPVFFAGVHGVAVGYFLSGSLPMVELLFDALTDISLLELCNQNDQPLLRELLLKAPGTHHHSFIVGILAEAAAESVGANPLLCRAGAYYHDIGKMAKPDYFAENMDPERSPHEDLEPTMSFLVICAHTKDGLEIGRRYGLHREILDFIPTHHGTTVVQYFYHKALSRNGGGDVPEESFRYPGPRPRTKETGIVNLADAVEASTRSLDAPSPASIRGQVHGIIQRRMMDGQLDETGLTFRDLSRVEEAFVRVLVGIFHVRPKYPEIRIQT